MAEVCTVANATRTGILSAIAADWMHATGIDGEISVQVDEDVRPKGSPTHQATSGARSTLSVIGGRSLRCNGCLFSCLAEEGEIELALRYQKLIGAQLSSLLDEEDNFWSSATDESSSLAVGRGVVRYTRIMGYARFDETKEGGSSEVNGGVGEGSGTRLIEGGGCVGLDEDEMECVDEFTQGPVFLKCSDAVEVINAVTQLSDGGDSEGLMRMLGLSQEVDFGVGDEGEVILRGGTGTGQIEMRVGLRGNSREADGEDEWIDIEGDEGDSGDSGNGGVDLNTLLMTKLLEEALGLGEGEVSGGGGGVGGGRTATSHRDGRVIELED
eukprot:GHVN01091190.1.p1 GENE.GHVN01091190.1~~GHVN01091190.1.p1  ORF type:complete len:350 (-),score=111.60 GHVN01091190.1:117-1097(-)